MRDDTWVIPYFLFNGVGDVHFVIYISVAWLPLTRMTGWLFVVETGDREVSFLPEVLSFTRTRTVISLSDYCNEKGAGLLKSEVLHERAWLERNS